MERTTDNNANYKYLLHLLSCVISGATPEKPNENTDWASVFSLANLHSVAGMTCYGVEKLPKAHRPCTQVMDKFVEAKRCELILESGIQFEHDRLFANYDNSMPRLVLLKGMIMKRYYPETSMRTMSDVDMLYREQDKKRVIEFFESQGYTLTLDFGGELNFVKPPFYHYELHPGLAPEQSRSYKYFQDIFERALFSDNSSVGVLSLEDTYIYMLEHLAKHIENAGAGLRMVMDVYVFLKKEIENLKTDIVNTGLVGSGLMEFSERISALAENWFAKGEADTSSASAQFILNSSTFGSSRTAILQTNIRIEHKTGKKQNGFKYMLRKMFPKYRYICARFPSAKKLRILYPFYIPAYWCQRIFRDRNVNTSNFSHYFAKTDSKEAKDILTVIDELGLTERLK